MPKKRIGLQFTQPGPNWITATASAFSSRLYGLFGSFRFCCETLFVRS